MAAKSIRKSVSFDDSDGDQALLDAIATQQSKHQQSFSDLCKQALHQYLLSREPTQSVLLFMELQHQIAQLGVRVAALEDETSITAAFSQSAMPTASLEEPDATSQAPIAPTDPVLNRLGPLLEDF
ncbi:MAG: hypothetical protein AAF282_16600 [Cyanobacteria bacterium P01_A01_bin.15]